MKGAIGNVDFQSAFWLNSFIGIATKAANT
jgi:hypothetical protein